MAEPHQEPVILNIYDLCWCNHCSFCTRVGLGAYHSGVEIYGKEFGYDGHDKDASGIFEIEPIGFEDEECTRHKTSIVMGHTSLTEHEVYQVLEQLGNDFKGIRYHCLNRNCNHFSSVFTKLLCDKDVPGWVNRLAYFATYIPFLENMCLTTEELRARTPPAAPAPPECKIPATPEENNNKNVIVEQPKQNTSTQPKPTIKWLYTVYDETLKTQLTQKTPETVYIL